MALLTRFRARKCLLGISTGAVLAQKFWGDCPHLPLHHRVHFLRSPKPKQIRTYSVCQKSDTLLVSEFSTLVRWIIFAIFVYLHIIYIKCLISEPVQVYCRPYRWTLQQDGAPSHTEKNTINYLKRENVSFIKPQMWPPNSPDYAVWGAFQQQV